MVVELTRDAARCDWLFLPSLGARSTALLGSASFASERGANALQRS